MASSHPFGRMDVAEFERRSALARRLWSPAKAGEHIAVLRLLTDFPHEQAAIRARAAQATGQAAEDELPDEFESLFAPRTLAQRDARAARAQADRIAASAGLDDDELYDSIMPPGQS
ncbi:MAG: hypothetical protein ACRDNZ_15820 [Streptosporangiaceae bacterium]